MKKVLLFTALLSAGIINAQNIFSEGFDNFGGLTTLGWLETNQSTPLGVSTWAQGGGTAFPGGGQAGGVTSFTLCNFNSTTGAGDISNWLITPTINLQNGDIVSFYTRKGAGFLDNLELRLSDLGAFTTIPSGGSTDLGSFTTLALTVNPTLTVAGYPTEWTQFSYTVAGLTGVVGCKIGFRYFVIDGGPSGSGSNIIAVDTFSVDRPVASTQTFFANNFSVYPNPANNVLNMNVKNGLTVNEVVIADVNGRTVKTLTNSFDSNVEMNISDLASGVYMLTIKTNEGVGNSKFVKN